MADAQDLERFLESNPEFRQEMAADGVTPQDLIDLLEALGEQSSESMAVQTAHAFAEDVRTLLGLESPPTFELKHSGPVYYGFTFRLGKNSTRAAFMGCPMSHSRSLEPNGGTRHPVITTSDENEGQCFWMHAVFWVMTMLAERVDLPGDYMELPGGYRLTAEQIERNGEKMRDHEAMLDYLKRVDP